MVAKRPLLYGPDNRPLAPWSSFQRRDAASHTGSMSNWRPRQVEGKQLQSMERGDIVARSINLVNDDPNAAGIIDEFATTIIGAGLRPIPAIDPLVVGISKMRARLIEAEQKAVYKTWSTWADSGERMSDGEIQHLKCRCLFGMGESFEIIRMIKEPGRPYSQASQVINPLRVRTPVDKHSDPTIVDGIRLGKRNQPVGYFVKKAGNLDESSAGFVEIAARRGHRWIMLHDFIAKDPEQMRGYPILAPAIRFFRDFSDLLGAELTSNVVTSALSMFIESDPDSYAAANRLLAPDAGRARDRWQDVNPGEIWYGSAGEKPHMLAANRPGTTFDPFTKIIKKSIAMATGLPYPIAFKDVDGVSFAGFRAAMLEAWRVFSYHRTRIGQKDPQKKYRMLMEEAYLKGEISAPDNFLGQLQAYTTAEWVGAPKGDIEPYKAIQADLAKNKAGVKTMERIITEDGGAGFEEVTAQVSEENQILTDRGISDGQVTTD